MADPRVTQYADLLLDYSLGVQAGWQVRVRSSHLGRPLVEAVLAGLGRRGAYGLVEIDFGDNPWLREAPLELVGNAAPLQRAVWEQADAFLSIYAPENTREGSDLSAERQAALERSAAPLRERTMSMSVPWVICEYAVSSIAQDAGMTVRELEEFLYGACLLDWEEEGRKMRRILELFDGASEVRVVGEGTDVTLSIEGRMGAVDDGHVNMPGGEVFFSPIEDSAEGLVSFCEFPAVYHGHEIEGAQLVFSGGEVMEATARRGEDFLVSTLDTDAGARRLGELGIGCNPGIQRFTKNVGFDEKIAGTIHLAVGASYTATGGVNESAVHWDMVKDLRSGGRLELDGRVVQENGEWRF